MSSKVAKKHKTVQDALIDFYVSVKPRKEDEEVTINNSNYIPIDIKH